MANRTGNPYRRGMHHDLVKPDIPERFQLAGDCLCAADKIMG